MYQLCQVYIKKIVANTKAFRKEFICSRLQHDLLISYFLPNFIVSFPVVFYLLLSHCFISNPSFFYALLIRPDPHCARNRGSSAIHRQTTAAQRDGRRLQPLSLRLAGLQTGENLMFVVCFNKRQYFLFLSSYYYPKLLHSPQFSPFFLFFRTATISSN